MTLLLLLPAARCPLPAAWPGLHRFDACVFLQIVNVEEVEGQPEDGAYIYGWFLQGARWDVPSQMLKESILKELFPPMPVVHLSAIPKETAVTDGFYVCPVYTTAARGAAVFVFPAGLRTNEVSNPPGPSTSILAFRGCLYACCCVVTVVYAFNSGRFHMHLRIHAWCMYVSKSTCMCAGVCMGMCTYV